VIISLKVDDVKLGAKVVLRPKQVPVEEPPPPELFMDEEEPDPVLSQGNAWVTTALCLMNDIICKLLFVDH
jgi:hypothetical protein